MIDPAYLETLGVFQDADGRYKRHRVKTRNAEYDPGDPKAELKGLVVAYEEELVPFPVVLPLATDPASIEEARGKAIAAGADFYHPTWGWLRWGIKPEKDHAENLGAATTMHPRRRVTVAGPSARPMVGVPSAQPMVGVSPAPSAAAPAKKGA